MTKSTVDLSKIKEEINKRKSTSSITEGSGPRGRDKFLYQLRKSFETGVQNESVNKIKTVANKATEKISEKHGYEEKKPYSNIGEHQGERIKFQDHDESERERQLFESFGASNKQTLADALEAQLGGKKQEQPMKQINEQALVNLVDSRLDNYLTENIGGIFNESIKNVILEHFTKEKIKEVILENDDLIREAVIKVIRELQKKKKTSN